MNEERVRLRLMGISYNPLTSRPSAMLLAEENGPYRLPIVIGTSEAQSIAIKLEGVIPPRPLTHDLFCSFCQAFGVELLEVNIYKYDDGIFSSELVLTDGRREVRMDSRTSDAVAIAVRTDSPIFISRQLLLDVGTTFQEEIKNDDNIERGTKKTIDNKSNIDVDRSSLSELEDLMQQCIDAENYEEAARIMEIIKKRNK